MSGQSTVIGNGADFSPLRYAIRVKDVPPIDQGTWAHDFSAYKYNATTGVLVDVKQESGTNDPTATAINGSQIINPTKLTSVGNMGTGNPVIFFRSGDTANVTKTLVNRVNINSGAFTIHTVFQNQAGAALTSVRCLWSYLGDDGTSLRFLCSETLSSMRLRVGSSAIYSFATAANYLKQTASFVFSTGQCKVYINGILDSTFDITTSGITISNLIGGFYLGSVWTGNNQAYTYFGGLKIYRGSQTDAQVLAISSQMIAAYS